DGWYDNNSFTGSVVLSIEASSTGNKAFYAKFNAIDYTITYSSNGGTNIDSEVFTIEDTIALANAPRVLLFPHTVASNRYYVHYNKE
ncbi:MAG: hypothetical protein EOM76_08670, partial [Sphingobacteriia bacterium]|nr:hypothetical protein [Sphingobacteriia bacterium]